MRGVKIAAAVVAIVVGGAAIWLALTPRAQEQPALPLTLEPSAHSGSLDARPSPISESLPVSRITPRAFAETAPAQLESASAPNRTVIRGRCVDARTLSPLAGCTVTVGWPHKPGDDVKLQQYLKHPESVRREPAQLVTLKDGRFELAFVSPEPYDFTLTIAGAGLASMCGHWPAPEPGALVELGDVLVRPGTLLRGRVVDENGSPQSGIRIALTRIEREKDNLGLSYPEIKESQHDGAFAFRQLFAAGSYRVEVSFQNWLLVEPRTIDIVDGDGVRSVDIHVQSFPDGDAISGVVTDDRGEPVSGAEVHHSPMTSGGHLVVRTGGDGAFRIRRSAQEPREAAVSLSASCPGYESKEDPTKYEWGAKGVSIVLKKGRTVIIAVRDGDLGKPVERYGVRCFPAPRSAVTTAEASRLRNRGEHPDGVLELDKVCSGRQTLIVEPEGAEWLPSLGQEFEMTDGGAPRQEVTVWRSVKKTLLVKSQSGRPVAGTKIELLRPLSGQTIDLQTRSLKLSDLDYPTWRAALLLDGGSTDEGGKLEVTGAPHEPLVLRALGPGHAPVVRDVSFDAPEAILEIVVPKGATLVGRILPLEILPQIDPRIANDGSRAGVVLRSPPPGRLEYPLGFRPSRIGDDGTFRIEDIPAGTWNVWIRYRNVQPGPPTPDVPGGASSMAQGLLTLGSIELLDGQERHEVFDLGSALRAQVDGIVTIDGRPIDNGTLLFEGKLENSSAEVSLRQIAIGSEGGFTALVWPGRYHVTLQCQTLGKRRRLQIQDLIPIRAGEKVRRTLDFRSSLLTIKVVGSDEATPVAGASLLLEISGSSFPAGPSDAQGRISVEDLPAGPITVLAWPKKFSAPDARRDLAGKAHNDVMVQVGTVVLTPPESHATIVLSASTGY